MKHTCILFHILVDIIPDCSIYICNITKQTRHGETPQEEACGTLKQQHELTHCCKCSAEYSLHYGLNFYAAQVKDKAYSKRWLTGTQHVYVCDSKKQSWDDCFCKPWQSASEEQNIVYLRLWYCLWVWSDSKHLLFITMLDLWMTQQGPQEWEGLQGYRVCQEKMWVTVWSFVWTEFFTLHINGWHC